MVQNVLHSIKSNQLLGKLQKKFSRTSKNQFQKICRVVTSSKLQKVKMSLLQCKNEKVLSLELLLNVKINPNAVKLKSKMDELSAVKKIQKEFCNLKTSTEKTVVCTVGNSTAGANAKIKSFIIHGGGHGVHPKRTEVMLFKNKSEGSRDGRNSPLFEQKVSNVRSADKYSITAAFNLIYKKNGLKHARYMVGIFSILKKGHGLQRCSSTGGGDSKGFTVAHEVDSQAKYISGNKLQCKSEDRSVHLQLKLCGIVYTIFAD